MHNSLSIICIPNINALRLFIKIANFKLWLLYKSQPMSTVHILVKSSFQSGIPFKEEGEANYKNANLTNGAAPIDKSNWKIPNY